MVKVPFVNLGLQFEAHEQALTEAFRSLSKRGAYVMSPELEEFEKRFAAYIGTEFAVGVGNATDGLFLTMKALNIGAGDEVITVSNSFIATGGAIANAGARAIFIDVGEDYNMDPDLLEPAITPRTRAILPVHLTGMPADMTPILEIAKRHELLVIEDAAQAVGAKYEGKRVGSLGIAGAFSLHPLKNLHVQGDGGVVTTNDATLYRELMKWRNHGLKNRDECDFFAYNSRLDSIQAAIANEKLSYLDQYTERFQEIAMRYWNGLKGSVEVPVLPENREGVFHNFVIQVNEREALMAFLESEGIETKIHYPIPIHQQKAAQVFELGTPHLPVTEKQAKRILSLPIYPELKDEQVKTVVDKINRYFN
ncbi:MAG: DegT/DnrJ/EryC1/StrS family aminotransferase [Pseudomonadota bacterium]